MAAIARSSRGLLRTLPVRSVPAVRAISSSAIQQRADAASSFESPFGKPDTNKIPDFSHYRSKNSGSGLLFQYFMVGTMGALTAAGAKATVQGA